MSTEPTGPLAAGFVQASRLYRDRVAQQLAGNITPLVWAVSGRCEQCGASGPVVEYILTDTTRRHCGPCAARFVFGDRRR